ncbi:hypothetical protein E2C01_014312 [Portunus trituberculatus]|uniref:Uncharacterized protein n=1 Tax=Portunus trituberculatus TaxID=210409 RepID=A0A5B7DJR9_PORTR|nr:hypothetical protein [Portunus trituberculatus]
MTCNDLTYAARQFQGSVKSPCSTQAEQNARREEGPEVKVLVWRCSCHCRAAPRLGAAPPH